MEITIPREEYKILFGAKVKLDVLCEILSKEERTYGYDTNTSETIDAILGIEREEK